jgi:hypothetical protein
MLGTTIKIISDIFLQICLLLPTRVSAYIRRLCRVGNLPHIIVKYTDFRLPKSNPKPSVFQHAQIINFLSAYLHGSRASELLINSVLQSALVCRRLLTLTVYSTLPLCKW